MLIRDQIIVDLKVQNLQTISYYEEQIDDLKDKLDRKEYVIQYKEHIWATFERELKKVVRRDSELYKKLQQTTQILVENLNETRVSNVVKENRHLINDHISAANLIEKIMNDSKQLLVDDGLNQKQKKRVSQTKQAKSDKTHTLLSSIILTDKLALLQKTFDSIKTRISIVEDENNFLRQEYSKVSKANIQMSKSQNQQQQRLKYYQD